MMRTRGWDERCQTSLAPSKPRQSIGADRGFLGHTHPCDRTCAGAVARSTKARAPSTTRASAAAGIAPDRIILVSARANPATIGYPSPPAPMNAAKVAAPTVMTAAVRTPAMIDGAARGSRTRTSRCQPVVPRASAASTASGAASRTPV